MLKTSSASRRPRPIARLTTIGCHALSKAETLTIAAIENAREIIAAFQAIETSGVAKDEAAIRAAITLAVVEWTVRGQITKRLMYRRGTSISCDLNCTKVAREPVTPCRFIPQRK